MGRLERTDVRFRDADHIVRVIERQKLLPIGSARFPRWLAILILYLAILGTVALVLLLMR